MRSTVLLRTTTAVVVIGAILGAAATFVVTSRQAPTSSMTPTDSRGGPTAASSRFGPAAGAGMSYVGPGFPGPYATPTADKAQSKLWRVGAQWWGVMLGPTGAWTVHRLDWASQAWQDTGTFVDERPGADADVLWDGAHLYVITAGDDPASSTGALRLARFSPLGEGPGFTMDPGYPIALTTGGVRSPTLAKDSTGRMWTVFQSGNEIQVAHTLDDDRAWTSPTALPAETTPVSAEESVAVVAYASRIGAMWSNQVDGAFYFASRSDTAEPDQWSAGQRVFEGTGAADDHINMKVEAGGRILAIVKTAFNDLQDRRPDSPGTVLLAMEPDGSWSQHTVSRVKDRHTRPIVLVDEALGHLHVFAADALGGTVYLKTASLESLEFAEGIGDVFITSSEHASTTAPTSTKQTVDASSGLVVLTSDPDTQNYVHGSMALGGPDPGTGPSAPPLTGPGMVTFFDDRFDIVPPGEPPGNGWTLSEAGTLTTAADGAESPVSALVSAPAGSVEARACKTVPRSWSGTLAIEMSVRLTGSVGSSVEVASIRGSGRELVSVRLAPGGAADYFDGAEKFTVPGVHQPGAWYRSSLTLDISGRTYGWELSDLATGTPVLTVSSAAWLPADSTEIDRLCVEVSEETFASLQFDDVLASRQAE